MTLIIDAIFSVFCLNLITFIACKKLPDIYWNTSNPIFQNVDNYTLQAKIRDTLEIHCPLMDVANLTSGHQPEYSIIYKVSKFGYENCLLDDEKPVGQCLRPFRETVIKMTFREFTPTPNGLEFEPGQTYYFISTSTGDKSGSHNRVGGMCIEKRLKLKFRISENSPAFRTPVVTPANISPKFRLNRESEYVSTTAKYDWRLGKSASSSLAIDNRLFDWSNSVVDWTGAKIQEIVGVDAKPLVDGRTAKSLAAPYERSSGHNSEKVEYNVQPLMLYEIHETSDFYTSSTNRLHSFSRNVILCSIFRICLRLLFL